MKSEQINELANALSKAQAEMRGASKDGLNPHRKSKYATLDSIWDACREPLSKNGLSISQLISQEGESVFLTTMLMHASGQWIDSIVPVTNGKAGPQELGASLTYMRRYSLAAIAGVTVGEDDDGEEAQKNHIPQVTEETLSKEEAKEISDLLGEDLDLYNKILAGYKVQKLTEIPSKNFQLIMRNIKTKKGIQ